jgi:beta-aspartyl-peptidase (threonine type)
MKNIAIAIHGGAGPMSDFIYEYKEEYKKSLTAIVQAGHKILVDGGTAVDAVYETVRRLEDDPLFNAGRGAALNSYGETRMDAAIMDGATLAAGAVANQHHIKNPIQLALAVMRDTPYVLLTGDGLEGLRKYKNIDKISMSHFITAHQLQKFFDHKKGDGHLTNDNPFFTRSTKSMTGTVGAVALDVYGNLASATSTGGADYCLPGRVSDSCIIGAGCYANNETCAVSGTGDGEYLMTGLTAHTISMMVKLTGLPIDTICSNVIGSYPEMACDIGVICLDRSGAISIRFNAERMHRAWIDVAGQLSCF